MLSPRTPLLVALTLLAGGLAVGANRLFTGEWITRFLNQDPARWTADQRWASVLLLGAIVVAAFAFGRSASFPRRVECDRADTTPPPPAWAFLPALLAYATATLLYLVRGEDAWVRLFWAAAIVALIVPLLRHARLRTLRAPPFWEYALLAMIVGAAFLLRYVRLTEIPYHVDNDVSIMGLLSRLLVVHGDWRLIGMAPTNHHYSEHQFIALSMRLFGTSHYGLGMLSVISGTATCVLVHLIGRLLFNRWVGLVAAAFLASNYVHIHFSRIIFGPISTFLVVLALLALLHGLKRGNRLSFALGGMSLGAGLLGYYSARIGPVVGGCLFLLWLLQRRRYPPGCGHGWLLALAGMLCVFGPNLAFALTDFANYSGRGNTVILWTDPAWNHLSAKYASAGNPFVVLREQVVRTFLAPFYFPDESTICHLRKPMLGALAAAAFILGLGYCLRRPREMACFALVGFVALTFVFGGVLTIDPPFWPHLNIALPAMALIAAVGLERFIRRLVLAWRPALRFLPAVAAGGLALSGLHDWEVYHQFARDHAGTRIHAMRQISRFPPDTRVLFLSRDVLWASETFQFFTPKTDGRNMDPAELFARPPVIDRPTAFFVFADADPACIEFLLRTYPGARRQSFRDGWQWPAFTLILAYPSDREEHPQAHLPASRMLWRAEGWRGLGLIVFAALWVGWLLILRERRPPRRRGFS